MRVIVNYICRLLQKPWIPFMFIDGLCNFFKDPVYYLRLVWFFYKRLYTGQPYEVGSLQVVSEHRLTEPKVYGVDPRVEVVGMELIE